MTKTQEDKNERGLRPNDGYNSVYGLYTRPREPS